MKETILRCRRRGRDVYIPCFTKATLISLVLWIIGFGLPLTVVGRAIQGWSYQRLYDEADLVIVGKPVSSQDTNEVTKLENGVEAVGLSSTMSVRTVLKGERDLTSIVLHHYRRKVNLAGPDRMNLVQFNLNPSKVGRYLMFLKKEDDGRYAPVSGQVDPALFSILKLDGLAD